MLRSAIFATALLFVTACSSPDKPGPAPAPTPTEPSPVSEPPGSAQAEPCPDDRCADGLECVRYYGIAGASGPEFTSCEIKCDKDPAACPEGQTCLTIADGPGQVCRPE